LGEHANQVVRAAARSIASCIASAGNPRGSESLGIAPELVKMMVEMVEMVEMMGGDDGGDDGV
jgi:hypothetical protein